MAFKKVQSGKGGEALHPQDCKGETGFYIGCKMNVGKFKSNVHKFKRTDGSAFEVWGCASLDNTLLIGKKPNPECFGLLCRMTYRGLSKGKVKKGQSPAKIVEVEVDSSRKLK